MINFYTIGGRKLGEVLLEVNRVKFSFKFDEPKKDT